MNVISRQTSLISFVMFFDSVIPRLDRGIQRKDLDFLASGESPRRPVKPENDNHWNRIRYEFAQSA